MKRFIYDMRNAHKKINSEAEFRKVASIVTSDRVRADRRFMHFQTKERFPELEGFLTEVIEVDEATRPAGIFDKPKVRHPINDLLDMLLKDVMKPDFLSKPPGEMFKEEPKAHQPNSNAMQLAELIAKAAHFGQCDKGGKPRFEHVKHVSEQMGTEKTRVVGMLHDTIEDSQLTTLGALESLFGAEISKAVDAVSRRQGEKYFDYIARCKENSIAREVKIADINHNMDKSRWPEMPDSYMEREKKALDILLN